MTQLDRMILERQERLANLKAELVELIRIRDLVEKGKEK